MACVFESVLWFGHRGVRPPKESGRPGLEILRFAHAPHGRFGVTT
jgi:hypothetical protein